MSYIFRRSNRVVLIAGVVTFLVILHVLYTGPTVPQWKTPSFLSSASSEPEDHVEQSLEGAPPLGSASDSGLGEFPSGAPQLDYDPENPYTDLLAASTTSSLKTSTSTEGAFFSSSTGSSSSSIPTSSTGSTKIQTHTSWSSGLTHGWATGLPKATNATSLLHANMSSPHMNGSLTHSTSIGKPNEQAVLDLPCNSLPGAEDILVVMRTGATEIRDKLTVHFNTTFKCYKNLVIFSDYEEVFEGHQVHDALKYMDDDIKNNSDEFEHYRHLKEVGRAGLDQSELSGKLSVESGPTGKVENAGWALDKWKFLPMANMTLSMYPDMKWYVFVEPDTYLVWSNLLQWIAKLDPTEALYAGSEVAIGDDIFAHGGSAFLMSRPALESGVDLYQNQTKELNDFTAGHWAGDCVLGKALADAGTGLTWSWPMFQGGNPNLMDYKEEKGDWNLWCAPALSYHHFNPSEIRDLFHFEQEWIKTKTLQINPSFDSSLQQPLLHHSDVFNSYVMPNLTMERSDWNNTSENLVPGTMGSTIADCRELCESKKYCMQYSAGPAGCYFDGEPRFGRRGAGFTSGWMVPRVEQWAKKLEKCKGQGGWTSPKKLVKAKTLFDKLPF